MQFERRATVVDSGIVETLDALLDDPFAICSIITDCEGRALDFRILRASPCFAEITGLPEPEGRTALELAPDRERAWIENYGRVALERTPMRFIEELTTAGAVFQVSAAPLDPPGCFVATFRDVTGRNGEASESAAAVAHAQRLFKELGHRVMNSFAAISAVIAMEARAAPVDARETLKRVQGRIQALATLYRRLDGLPEVDRIEVSGYLSGNIQSFSDSLAVPAGLAIEADLAPLTLSTRAAVPLALILNELLTDAAAQALATGRSGALRISLRDEGGQARLTLEHDGGALVLDGISRILVEAFVAELEGELDSETMPRGTRMTLVLPA